MARLAESEETRHANPRIGHAIGYSLVGLALLALGIAPAWGGPRALLRRRQEGLAAHCMRFGRGDGCGGVVREVCVLTHPGQCRRLPV